MFDPATVFLVVDDFDLMHKVINDQLRSLGAVQILSASNGLEALNILKCKRVDIIISDWNMPIMSGLDFLKLIRANSSFNRLPFIMITGEANVSCVREAIGNGVTSLLIKPYTLNNLTGSLHRAFSFKSSHSDHSHSATNTGQAQTAQGVQAMAPQTDRIKETASDSDGLSILIVDDTLDNVASLSSLFKASYRVLVAQDGAQAMALCHSDTPPDLVLIDVRMAGINGFDMLQTMRQHPASEKIPAIFITSRPDVIHRIINQEKDLNSGVVDYVMKPVDPAVLKLRVRNFMRTVNLNKQLQQKYDALSAMAKLREDIEHATSHDLRSPLSGLLGMVQLLIDESASMNPKQIEQLQVVERISLDVLDMAVLSSKILKIETGEFKLQPSGIDVSSMLGRIADSLKGVYCWKKLLIEVRPDVPEGGVMPQAMGDATLCYAMLNNLLKNACESAPEHSCVLVTLSSEGGLRLKINIASTGVISMDIRPVFFEKFVPSRKGNGSHLEIYYAHLMARAQKGSVTLDVSDLDNQTTVTVTLPC